MIARRDGVYPGDAEEEDEPEPEGEEKETTCSTLQAGTRAPTGSRAVPASSTTQAAVFALVWIAWANGSLHHELHGHHDARARTRFLLQILVLAAMGTFIPQAGAAGGHSPSPRRCCSRCWPCCGCWPRAATAPNTTDRADY